MTPPKRRQPSAKSGRARNKPGKGRKGRRRPRRKLRRQLRDVLIAAVVGTAIANLISYFYPGVFRLLPPFPWTTRKVAVAVERLGSNHWILPDRPIASYGVPPTDCGTKQWDEWLKNHGGMPGGEAQIHVTLTSYREQSAVIESIEVERIVAEPLPVGINVTCPQGDGLQERVVAIKLDEKPPTVEYIDEEDRRRPRFAFRLRPGEVERFLLLVSGDERASYRWTATISLLEGTKRRKIRVTDNGQPFTVTPTALGPSYQQLGQRWDEVKP